MSAMRRAFALMRAHPVITAVNVACVAVAPAIAVATLPESWETWRAVALGLIGGAGCGLMITAPRIVGPAGS